MTTAIKRVTVVAQAPNSKGTFDGRVDFNPSEGDSDGERIVNFTNVPGEVPLSYQHAIGGDPGAVIGTAKAREVGGKLDVSGVLNILNSKMAQAVHERMLLPDDDPMALKELSVGFAYDPTRVKSDSNGVKAIPDAQLLEISIVYRGAQVTKISNVKELKVLAEDVRTGLLSFEDAIRYAADTDLDPEITASMIKAAFAERKEYVDLEPIDGSFEDVQEDVQEALRAWAIDKYPDADPDCIYVSTVATFPGHVVFSVDGSDSMDSDPEFFQADYVINADDTVDISNAKPVDVSMTITPDADAGKAAAGAKAWDGQAAMQSCSSEADFKKIAFERNNDSDPATAAHYALPHHDGPGEDANPKGVSSALGALNGGRSGTPMAASDFKEPIADIRKHLEDHAAASEGKSLGTVSVGVELEKAGRAISAASAADLKGTLALAVDDFVARCNGDEVAQKGDVEGHDFHGNQWAAGAAGRAEASTQAANTARSMGNENAAAHHDAAAAAHTAIAGGLSQNDSSARANYHTGAAATASTEAERSAHQGAAAVYNDHAFGAGAQALGTSGTAYTPGMSREAAYGPASGADVRAGVGGAFSSASSPKAAAVKDEVAQKGDVEGHDFHGNQWTSGGGTAASPAGGYGSGKDSNGHLVTASATQYSGQMAVGKMGEPGTSHEGSHAFGMAAEVSVGKDYGSGKSVAEVRMGAIGSHDTATAQDRVTAYQSATNMASGINDKLAGGASIPDAVQAQLAESTGGSSGKSSDDPDVALKQALEVLVGKDHDGDLKQALDNANGPPKEDVNADLKIKLEMLGM